MPTDIEVILSKAESILTVIKQFGFTEPVNVYLDIEKNSESQTALQITALSPEAHKQPLKMRSFVELQLKEELGYDVIFKSSSNIGPLYTDHFNKHSTNLRNTNLIKEQLSSVHFAKTKVNDSLSKQLLALSKKHCLDKNGKDKKPQGLDFFIKKPSRSKQKKTISPEAERRIIDTISELPPIDYSRLLSGIIRAYTAKAPVGAGTEYQQKLLNLAFELEKTLQDDEIKGATFSQT